MEERLSITIWRSSALVLFEMLSREFEEPEYGGIDKLASDSAEHWALNELLRSIETLLEEPFAENYLELVAKAKSEILRKQGEVLR